MGSNWMGSDWMGSDWMGSDWMGSDGMGSDWMGSDWMGSDWMGSDWTEIGLDQDWIRWIRQKMIFDTIRIRLELDWKERDIGLGPLWGGFEQGAP